MRTIQFDLSDNTISADDEGTNESIKIQFLNCILNESIVKLNRGAYIEKILLDFNDEIKNATKIINGKVDEKCVQEIYIAIFKKLSKNKK